MNINLAGFEIVKSSEGLSLTAYKCPAGVMTIGYGHTGDVTPGMRITEHQAEAVLLYDLDKFEMGVAFATKGTKLNSNQFSALVSLAFNIGLDAFDKSTLLKLVKAEKFLAAAEQFSRWTKANGKELPGLVKRRAAEKALFLRPMEKALFLRPMM